MLSFRRRFNTGRPRCWHSWIRGANFPQTGIARARLTPWPRCLYPGRAGPEAEGIGRKGSGGKDQAGRATPRPLGDRGARPTGVSGFASHNCSQDTAGWCLVAGEEPARLRVVEVRRARKGGCLHAGLLPCCAFFGPGGPVVFDPVWRCDPSPSAPRPGKPGYRTPGPRLPHRPTRFRNNMTCEKINSNTKFFVILFVFLMKLAFVRTRFDRSGALAPGRSDDPSLFRSFRTNCASCGTRPAWCRRSA